MGKLELRAVIKQMCLKNLITERVKQHLQNTSGANALPYPAIARWCAEFERGRTSSNYGPRFGHSVTVVTEEMVEGVSERASDPKMLKQLSLQYRKF
ncbi:hypothetical protein EVAR_11339_1 [Eumeta japonica]|uniref:Mos1 transposase HTH domain-containing protein n=1 Tax=Eumeta variegata TaxID=151549 RepID=A0A4C1U0Z1_EUMVA|nr:hypothetical protein EVAR_11339_1 [Eumeta japonica]